MSSSKWSEVGMPTLQNDSFNDSHSSDIFNDTSNMTPIPPDNLLPAPVQQNTAASATGGRKQKKSARIGGGLKVHWVKLKKRIGTGTAPSTSSMIGESSGTGSSQRQQTTDDEKDEVDEVIVDRTWSEDISVAHSDAGPSPEKSNSHQHAGTSLEHESVDHIEGFRGLWTPLIFLRWRLWPLVWDFFTSRFVDEKAEQYYRKENWFIRKVCSQLHNTYIVANIVP